jgi:hypothetical protein
MTNNKRTCPYCGNDQCEAGYVDVGIGYQQCSPFYCEACGACEIGGYDDPVELTDKEKKTHWYEPGRSHLTCAPTFNGVPVGDHELAMDLYRIGLLDENN